MQCLICRLSNHKGGCEKGVRIVPQPGGCQFDSLLNVCSRNQGALEMQLLTGEH